ncbi:MAG TPA: sigma-70 family RNA polymerase sigma factor, partial [Candidatus Sulfomarinibacteraceae bacterium]|nr:sigma-70 family RNA polymerase sigma factor [Candidatus Sulfomarinibacteraceae bacterium]
MASSQAGKVPGGLDPWRPPIDSRTLAAASRPDDERAIVAAVLGGDRDAFRTLVDRESAAIVRACHRVLGDLAEAEDVAQEAFVIAYRSLATWRADGPFGAWLSRIAVRLAVRQASKRKTVAWARPADGEDHDARIQALPAGRGSDPEGLVLRGERQRTVRDAVTRLEEPYREVVALRFFAERSLDEIATITGRPLGTVKT